MALTADQAIFAIKLYLAGMIAFSIAAWIGLPQPYWALVTCGACMNPTSGAIRSKAAYRFFGTFSAGVATLLLASVFGNVSGLFILSLGIAICTAMGLSFIDRTPRSYAFWLFGLTLALIAVPAFDHPERLFDTMVARVSEIGLGVIVVTMVDSVIAPRSSEHMLRASLARWLPSMKKWAMDVVEGHPDDAQAAHDRLKSLADIITLSQTTAQLRYDPAVNKGVLNGGLAIQQRLIRMIPLLSAIGDRIAALDAQEREAIAPPLALATECLEVGRSAPPRLIEALHDLPKPDGPRAAWLKLVHGALADMMADMLMIWSEIHAIDRSLNGSGDLSPALARDVAKARNFPLKPDIGLAVQVSLGLFAGYLLLCGFWYATGWRQGANTFTLAVALVGFFGMMDQPGRIMAVTGRLLMLALVLSIALNYGLLPLATDYPTFLAVMAIFILPLAAWIAVNPMVLLIFLFSLSGINLQASYTPAAFDTFLEANLALIPGFMVATLCMNLSRTLGVDYQVHRVLRMEIAEISRLSRTATSRERNGYVERALNRIAALSTRLAANGQIERSATLLVRMRAGLNIGDLRMAADRLGAAAREKVEQVLESAPRQIDADDPSPQFLTVIDTAMDTVRASDGTSNDDRHATLHSLAGLRLALFHRAPAWEPAP
ncbi:FUSC family protein [Sphingobium lactosutens]|uniref:Fusaric acid resistance protein n=1 Tax=Sphingobium lactosutens DS20 TaxID=1331060 RepID=T0IT05_9SPHN|nr:FUSC family protein [Sphingobium lactosutens]EQB14965.1 hypothetical protein RLDS_12400 [Sphingobium lactosutens DS20]